MSEEIKGILNLDNEEDSRSLGIRMGVGCELDRVTLNLVDKDGNDFGNLVFQCDEFRKLMDSVVNPKPDLEKEDLPKDVREQVDKEIQADAEEMEKNPVSEEIAKYHI